MGPQERFQTLVDEHRKIVYKICAAYCRNVGDREDLAQEIVIALWRALDSFDGRVLFSTWMYRVALNVAISFYRRDERRTRPLAAIDDTVIAIREPDEREPEDVLLLYQFIEGLDELNKALVLLYLDGHSYREISDVLGITETNVATKLSRLKTSMKHQLAESQDRGGKVL